MVARTGKRRQWAWLHWVLGGNAARAQSMVEFALIIPLFIGLILAIFDTARFMATYAGISNGVRAGARVATISSATNDQIKDAVVAAVVLVDAAAVRSSVTITPTSGRTAFSQVTVAASENFTFNPLFAVFFSGFSLNSVAISQTATTTVEGP